MRLASSEASAILSLCLALNLSCARDGIGRDAEDFGAGFGEGGAVRRKRDRLLGAAGGIGFGIEIEDEVAALEILQRYRRSAVARQTEGRRLRRRDKFACHMPSFRRFRAVNGGNCHVRRVGASGSTGTYRGRAGRLTGARQDNGKIRGKIRATRRMRGAPKGMTPSHHDHKHAARHGAGAHHDRASYGASCGARFRAPALERAAPRRGQVRAPPLGAPHVLVPAPSPSPSSRLPLPACGGGSPTGRSNSTWRRRG